ncbi:MAG: efflux RND transporter periplasmic adaptor subunit [Alphaproteobacteria bacterium]
MAIAAILVVGASIAWGFGYFSKTAATSRYKFAQVERGALVSAIAATGTLNPVITVQVGSQVSGQVKELFADFNSEVKQNELIARINPDILETHVAQAEADKEVAETAVLTARAAIEKARADVENARANLAALEAQTVKAKSAVKDASQDLTRKKALFERGFSPTADRDKAQATYDQAVAQQQTAEAQERVQTAAIHSTEAQQSMAEAELQNAIATVKQREAAAQQARVDLDHTYIRAPVDGVVIARNVDVGQTVAASLQAPVLFTIAKDLRQMQIDTSVDEADVGRVAVGQAVTFTVDAFPGKEFTGKVSQVRKAPQVIQNVVTYDVVIAVDNTDQLLLPGMTANVRVEIAGRTDALKVPNAALRFRPADDTGTGTRVFITGPDGKPKAVPVSLGVSDGTFTELVGGDLAEGARVIVGIVQPSQRPGAPASPFGRF